MVRVSQIKFKTLKVGRQLLFTIFRQKRTPLIKSSISYSNVLVCHIIPRVLGNFGLQLLLEHFPPFCLVNNGLDVMNVLKNRACFFFFFWQENVRHKLSTQLLRCQTWTLNNPTIPNDHRKK